MKVIQILALFFTLTALTLTPAWSKHDKPQPIETPDGQDFVQPGKTLSISEQLTELEMMVLSQDYPNDPMQMRVSRLVHQVMPGQERSVDSLSIEGQVGRVWEALQASPRYNTNRANYDRNNQDQVNQDQGNQDQANRNQANRNQVNQNNDNIATTSNTGTSFVFPSSTGQSEFQSMAPDGRSFHPGDGDIRLPIGFDQGHEDINLNRRIMAFAAHNFGKQVGNGECWTLAADALQEAGGMPPQDYVFGRALARNEQWWPGDIIQFTKCRFKESLPGPGNRHMIITAGAPNHTAIYGGQENGSSMIAQQNNNGVKRVSVMYLDFDTLVSGNFNVYRPLMPPPSQGISQ